MKPCFKYSGGKLRELKRIDDIKNLPVIYRNHIII